jgi:HlyD family type I secretion membrane fusion protein
MVELNNVIKFDEGATAEPEKATDTPGLGGSLKWAIYGTVGVFAALLLFAFLAPISGGAIATGVISPEGSKKIVQHLEGGVISRILVKDGDVVREGDPLLALNETQIQAERNITQSRLRTLKVMEARIESEQLGLREFIVPFETTENDIQINSFIQRQQTLLNQSLDLGEARSNLFTQRAGQLRSEIEGLNGQIDSLRGQQVYLRQEIRDAEILTEKELFARPRLLALRRQETSIDGDVASAQAQIARLRGQISEIGVQRLELEAERQSELARQLAEIRADLSENEERLIAAEDVLSRTIVRAPIDGTVVNLQYKTVGGVVSPAQTILDIVPSNERLIIEANVLPTDIDIIQPGQIAKITFSGLPRSLPQIDGNVLQVNADSTIDERTGIPYFKVRIEVPQETLVELGIDNVLSPGMPADVMIKTESRTVMEYILQPFNDTFRKGMRESNSNAG